MGEGQATLGIKLHESFVETDNYKPNIYRKPKSRLPINNINLLDQKFNTPYINLILRPLFCAHKTIKTSHFFIDPSYEMRKKFYIYINY